MRVLCDSDSTCRIVSVDSGREQQVKGPPSLIARLIVRPSRRSNLQIYPSYQGRNQSIEWSLGCLISSQGMLHSLITEKTILNFKWWMREEVKYY